MGNLSRRGGRRLAAVVASCLLVVSAPAAAGAATPTPTALAAVSTLDTLVPAPVSARAEPGQDFRLTPGTAIVVPRGAGGAGEVHEVREVADLLAADLRPATGFPLSVATDSGRRGNTITLRLTRDARGIGAEGYRLDVARSGVTLEATGAAGLRNATQTLRQLLPPAIEAESRQDVAWTVPGAHIVDQPRYAYRGAMLDVARYYFPPDVVHRFIDQLGSYKVNRLHLHLTDDQGWRLQVDSWPRLATHGGSTQTGGGPGGYYTKAEYAAIVEHARERGITVVPEVDMPGHTTAALSSYGELTCDGVAPPLYTGYDVGFSSLCLGTPTTARFVDDVLREVAALTPGEYIHIGGDEAAATTPEADYTAFMAMATATAAKYGKKVIGWNSALASGSPFGAGAVAQYWYPWPDDATARDATARGAKLIMSPAHRAYLDMKYTATEPLYGQAWAGYVEARNAYEWNPDTTVNGVPASAVLGVEATLFTQITPDEKSVQFMLYPRLPELAEVAWTPLSGQSWDRLRTRLPAQAQRWDAWGVNYYRSPQIPWVG
ncbi:beta-N-acetylhexosaminidase [Actinokineospora bangkokensis]|uniref:beta-N-acetylhexosaminidase n=1 Tax=Actinokineospora bangkokensis TaxID=1193682 RepID=A0A1Q9LP57_9PSEU|nr:beta-N-acetylhexosaminidase [Actinokineospora bangkokensis]OLR93784.1 beta-N-acetylhexosaminidase [Actinokineospora bangkokensis]